MDVANSHHLGEREYDSDITPEAIARIRKMAAPALEDRVFTLVSSADPASVLGQDYRVKNGVIERV